MIVNGEENSNQIKSSGSAGGVHSARARVRGHNRDCAAIMAVVDGSFDSSAAVQVSLGIASICHSRTVHVLLLHQQRELSPMELVNGLHLSSPAFNSEYGMVVEQAKERLENIIGNRVRDKRVNLVIVASRWPSLDEPGRFPGKAAEQIISRVDVPVLLVPPGMDITPDRVREVFSRIQVHAAASGREIKFPLDLADRCGARVLNLTTEELSMGLTQTASILATPEKATLIEQSLICLIGQNGRMTMEQELVLHQALHQGRHMVLLIMNSI